MSGWASQLLPKESTITWNTTIGKESSTDFGPTGHQTLVSCIERSYEDTVEELGNETAEKYEMDLAKRPVK